MTTDKPTQAETGGKTFPPKLIAYLTHGGDWHATEEKNFRPNMLFVPEELRVNYVPQAALDEAAAIVERKDREISRLRQEQETLRAELEDAKGWIKEELLGRDPNQGDLKTEKEE